MPFRYGFSVLILALVVGLVGQTADAACIVGELANFDIHNFQIMDVYSFELTLQGDYTDKIESFYESSLYGPPTVMTEDGNTIIRWDFYDPLPYCTWIHLGVRLDPGVGAPVVVGSTINDAAGDPISTLPFPWQRWIGTVECPVIDVIEWNATIPVIGVRVDRQGALSEWEIPLQNLTITDPMVETLPWMSFGARLLLPDSVLTLTLFTSGQEAAVVRYDVSSYDGMDYYLRFLSEAVLTYGPSAAEPSTWGRIKGMFR
jgi:hypothetical protein